MDMPTTLHSRQVERQVVVVVVVMALLLLAMLAASSNWEPEQVVAQRQ